MNTHIVIQGIILSALGSGYSEDDIRENVEVALERHHAHTADREEDGSGFESIFYREPIHGDDLPVPDDDPDLRMPGDTW